VLRNALQRFVLCFVQDYEAFEEAVECETLKEFLQICD